LTTSTILSMDLVKPHLKPDFTEDKLLSLSRFFIVFIGIFSLLLALILKGVISSLLLGYTVYTSGLIFPILLGFYRHKLKLNRAGAISAMAVGGGLALIGKIMGWNFFGLPAGLYGFFLSGLTIVIVSRFSR
jgi:SSS family solute:Na+ symporter